MKPNFFKVYIVLDDLKTIWIRDCFKLTDKYVYLRPTRSRGTEQPISYCILPKFTSKRYFKTLKEAKNYINQEHNNKINKAKIEIDKIKKSIEYFKSQKNIFELKTDFDYDDRGVNYERYIT